MLLRVHVPAKKFPVKHLFFIRNKQPTTYEDLREAIQYAVLRQDVSIRAEWTRFLEQHLVYLQKMGIDEEKAPMHSIPLFARLDAEKEEEDVQTFFEVGDRLNNEAMLTNLFFDGAYDSVVPLDLKEGESSLHLSFEVPELSAVAFKIRNTWQIREGASETIALDIAAASSTPSSGVMLYVQRPRYNVEKIAGHGNQLSGSPQELTIRGEWEQLWVICYNQEDSSGGKKEGGYPLEKAQLDLQARAHLEEEVEADISGVWYVKFEQGELMYDEDILVFKKDEELGYLFTHLFRPDERMRKKITGEEVDEYLEVIEYQVTDSKFHLVFRSREAFEHSMTTLRGELSADGSSFVGVHSYVYEREGINIEVPFQANRGVPGEFFGEEGIFFDTFYECDKCGTIAHQNTHKHPCPHCKSTDWSLFP